MKLSIITVNTNDREKILEQIKSVQTAAEGIEFEQIISDNGSTDDSIIEIKKLYPHVQIVENGKNIGFGAANNSAFKISTGEYILCLNPDMRLTSGSLKILLNWMEQRGDVGIASPKLVDENGNFNQNAKPRRFPHLFDQIAILLKLPHLFPDILGNYLYKDLDFSQEQEVDSVRGSFMLMRRAFLAKLGWMFDPRYFIWFEDVDICREAWRNGYKVMYAPIISCVDYVGQTFRRLPGLQKQRWFTDSMVKYFKKWHTVWEAMMIMLIRSLVIGVTWSVYKIRSVENNNLKKH